MRYLFTGPLDGPNLKGWRDLTSVGGFFQLIIPKKDYLSPFGSVCIENRPVRKVSDPFNSTDIHSLQALRYRWFH